MLGLHAFNIFLQVLGWLFTLIKVSLWSGNFLSYQSSSSVSQKQKDILIYFSSLEVFLLTLLGADFDVWNDIKSSFHFFHVIYITSIFSSTYCTVFPFSLRWPRHFYNLSKFRMWYGLISGFCSFPLVRFSFLVLISYCLFTIALQWVCISNRANPLPFLLRYNSWLFAFPQVF